MIQNYGIGYIINTVPIVKLLRCNFMNIQIMIKCILWEQI